MQKNHLKHSSIVKSLSKLPIEGYCLKLIKGIYKNLTANIIFNDERLNSSPFKFGTSKSWKQVKNVHIFHF